MEQHGLLKLMENLKELKNVDGEIKRAESEIESARRKLPRLGDKRSKIFSEIRVLMFENGLAEGEIGKEKQAELLSQILIEAMEEAYRNGQHNPPKPARPPGETILSSHT